MRFTSILNTEDPVVPLARLVAPLRRLPAPPAAWPCLRSTCALCAAYAFSLPPPCGLHALSLQSARHHLPTQRSQVPQRSQVTAKSTITTTVRLHHGHLALSTLGSPARGRSPHVPHPLQRQLAWRCSMVAPGLHSSLTYGTSLSNLQSAPQA